jgi:hypothetical protein
MTTMETYTGERRDLVALPYDPTEARSVIMVRLPRALHAELARLAHREQTSLNAICVSKLIGEIPACPIIPRAAEDRARFADWRNREAVVRRCRGCRTTGAAAADWPEWDLCRACVAPLGRPESQESRVEGREP